MRFALRKAQGSAEYLILLAVVLIIAIVGIALLGGFTGFGGDARLAESKQYWGQARPFGITEFSQQQGTMYLRIQNTEPERLVITNVSIGNASWADSNGITFNGGANKNLSVAGLRVCNSTSYDTFEYNVTFTYTTSSITGSVQRGTKPLSGKCVE